jgi:hypothetical protein
MGGPPTDGICSLLRWGQEFCGRLANLGGAATSRGVALRPGASHVQGPLYQKWGAHYSRRCFLFGINNDLCFQLLGRQSGWTHAMNVGRCVDVEALPSAWLLLFSNKPTQREEIFFLDAKSVYQSGDPFYGLRLPFWGRPLCTNVGKLRTAQES